MVKEKKASLKEQIETEFYYMLTTGKVTSVTEYFTLFNTDPVKAN